MAELKRIYGQDKAQGLVLIFVHGLGDDLYQTWMSYPKNKNTFWPGWVAKDCDCTTWTLGYDANLSAWENYAMPLPDQAEGRRFFGDKGLKHDHTSPFLSSSVEVKIGALKGEFLPLHRSDNSTRLIAQLHCKHNRPARMAHSHGKNRKAPQLHDK